MKQLNRLTRAALLAMAAVGFASRNSHAADPVLEGCLVKLDENIEVPAPEAGVLVQLAVKEGSQVRQGDVLAKIYDEEVQIQKRAAEYARGAAYKAATDNVQERYARASAAVAQKKYESSMQANERVPGSISQVDIDKDKLEWDAAVLSTEKAIHDQALAKYEYGQKDAELKAANLALERRQIRAPFDGEVVTIFRHQDEWVSPGDAILRLVKLDTMLVEGALDRTAFDPHEVMGAEVVVDVELARGRKEQFVGRITYVSPMLRSDGRYAIRAEIANRQEYGRWLLGDRMLATMTIHLGTARDTSVDVSRNP